MCSAPGVIISKSTYTDVPLNFYHHFNTPSPAIETAMTQLRSFWEAPDDWPMDDARHVWALARQLAKGFYYRPDPRPPKEWLDRRRAWCGSVRRVLEWGDRRYDTPGRIEDAVKAGTLQIADYAPWAEIRNTFIPNVVETWLCDSVLERIEGIVEESGQSTLIWVEHIEVGRALAQRNGWPYYRDRGFDSATGMHLKDSPVRTVVASVKSCSEGLQLQGWCRALIVDPSSTNPVWEQTVSRPHRIGQTQPVETDVLHTCLESVMAVKSALQEARAEEGNTHREQKILFGGLTVPKIPANLKKLNTYRK